MTMYDPKAHRLLSESEECAVMRNDYNAIAVQKAIDASNRAGRRISKRETARIHALLRGWRA